MPREQVLSDECESLLGALTGRVAENPTITRQLHDVIDGVCEQLY